MKRIFPNPPPQHRDSLCDEAFKEPQKMRLPLYLLVALFLAAASQFSAFAAETNQWRKVDDGLWYGQFEMRPASNVGNSMLLALKIDPDKYKFVLLDAKKSKTPLLPLAERCRKHGLLAGINAGMFANDFRTHVGYMRHGELVDNPRQQTDYLSAFAFDPVEPNLPQARFFDLDEVEFSQVLKKYRSVVQNLRLIKAPGENRWSKQTLKWSEAALGQDADGNILFLFCRSPYTMHDFNDILLKLPIKLVAAHHLDGGAIASFYINHGDVAVEAVGSYQSGTSETDDNTTARPVPIVLGISKR